MKLKKILSLGLALALAFTVSSVSVCAVQTFEDIEFSEIPVNNGEVIKGVDVSSVIALEKSGVVFKDANGNPQDIFATLKNAGVNYVRVRIWNDPYTSDGKTYGGGANDIDTAVKIAERCQKNDLKMLVDFHYSDFWADPGKQFAPKAWRGFSVDQKAQAINSYTYDSLKKIGQTGVTIGMVQLGNETTSGMCGETNWEDVSRLMNAGAAAVRSYSEDILIAVHFTNPEKNGHLDSLASLLQKGRVDYDVFATSYYPYWHGTLSNLTNVLKNISQKYDKYVMVAETSWANTFEDSDCFGNTVSSMESLGDYVSYEVSVNGQVDFLSDLFRAVSAVGSDGIGVFYWEPAWITVGDEYYSNLGKWEKDGSGWASQAAMEYQEDAKYFGGSAVDNQALFAQDGTPLDSLYVFEHIFTNKERKNLLSDPGFENAGNNGGATDEWIIKNTTSGEYSKFTINSEMARTGNYSAHWYSPSAFENSVMAAGFLADETGKYEFSCYIAGEGSEYSVSVISQGEKKTLAEGITVSYDKWERIAFDFLAEKNENFTIIIDISGKEESYGSVDDCSLYFTKSDNNIKKGDINNDGKLSSSDLVGFIQYMNGICDISKEQKYIIDMNDDGKVNIIDMILLKKAFNTNWEVSAEWT